MARTKRSASKSAPPSAPPATLPTLSPAPTSKFSSQLRFPVLVILSMTLSSVLYSVASPFTSGDLATVSRSHDQWWEVGGLLGWKAAQLAVGWYGGYDSYDFAALTFLSHVPYHYFLASFYLIRPTTAIGCLAIDTMAVYLPFRLLKVSSSIHSIKTPKGVAANRIVINDFGVQVYASLFAAGIYGVIVSASYVTWLPVYLINHFDGIRDISIIHNRNFPWLMASYIPMGFAAKVFMFTPSTAAKPDAYDKEIAKFNPESATLSQTVIYNFWGFSKRTRTLIKRTATVVVVGGLHTWLQTYVSLEGAEAFGAAGWSSVWAIAATWVGVAFWWVADVEGMSN